MSQVTIYHNPRCSKSRQTLDLIRRCGIEPEIVTYLTDPPTESRLDSLLQAMGKEPLEVLRSKEALFKELGLSTKDPRSRNEWIKLMVTHPKLLERPIVVAGNRVVLGRPPENVLDILD